MKNAVLTILFALAFSVQAVVACSLAVKPLAEFDDTEYVFIGEVVGYTAPVETTKFQGAAYGLIVKIKESVYLPKTPKQHFEIFPITLWADCSISGTKVEKLKKDFPVKAEIRVIAKEANLLPVLANGNVRLEDRPGERGSIVLNNDPTAATSANSVFDYKSYRHDIDEDSTSKYLLPVFEARKDLLRLKNSKTQAAKNEILARFLYFPIGYSVDVYEVVKKYSENKNAYDHLYCQRLLEIEGLSDEEFRFLTPTLPKVCSQYKNKG
jgi:hypothetical protein